MPKKRSCGILLPVTALWNKEGIGTLGKEAYRWVDFLAEAGQTYWQILPYGPTGYGDSPYQTFSAFAGNPLWIDLSLLTEEGLLDKGSLHADFPENFTDYGQIVPYKKKLLALANKNFRHDEKFAEFCRENAFWLDNYALYTALKEAQEGKSWQEWSAELKNREKSALIACATRYEAEIAKEKFIQYKFFEQWKNLKQYANLKGINIIGDIPIYTSMDSADVWANRKLFMFDSQGNPLYIAGVPPDAFTADGQLWGNPMFAWEEHKKDNFAWWIERLRMAAALLDVVRIDHFRGFEACYSVPYGATSARFGKWIKAPGTELFRASKAALGHLHIIAEDLGFLTEEVHRMREELGFPGMKILQFAFDSGANNPYLPWQYEENCVVYPGTHDNQTLRGWYYSLQEATRAFCDGYLCAFFQGPVYNPVKQIVEMAFASKANLVIVPIWDWLQRDNSARFNTPGQPAGNWTWRLTDSELTTSLAEEIKIIAKKYER